MNTHGSRAGVDASSALDYHSQRIAAPGSTLHYAARFAKADDRAALLGLFALADELQDLAWSRDTDLAAARLHWWSDEIACLWHGSPRHPATVCLAALRPQFDPAPLIRSLEAVSAVLEVSEDAGPQRSGAHYQRVMWSEVMICICRVLGGHSSASDGFARHLGNGHGLAELLLNLGLVARRRPALLPRELSAAASNKAALAYAVHEHTAAAGEAFAAARRELPPDRLRGQLPALVLAAIDEATLAEMDPHSVTEVRTRLTPLRRAWIALRTHRQVTRQEKRS
jgi:phytoene synthase